MSCGACVESCPTGALTEKSLAQVGQPDRGGADHLRLLRRGLLLHGRGEGPAGGAHGAGPRRRREPWPRLREGPLCLRLCHAWRSHHQADDPREDHRSVARGELGRGLRVRGLRVQAHPEEVRPLLRRRHHLLPLHQRGSLPGAEAGARRARHQQRRYLRARLPFAHGLWPEADAGRIRRHAEFRFGDEVRRDHRGRRQPDRRPSGVRLAHEAPAARRREADRGRSARDRPGALAACPGRLPPAAAPRHQRGAVQFAGACGGHRRPGGREVRGRALRAGVRSSAGAISSRCRRIRPRRWKR